MLAITWRAQAARRLEAAGSPDPMADARLLSWGDSLREISPQEEARLEARLKRRLAGEPVQYILEAPGSWGWNFTWTGACSSPGRTRRRSAKRRWRFCGIEPRRACSTCAPAAAPSGLSLAKLCPQARVTLADVSADAGAVMEENRRRLGVEAEIVRGDLFAPVAGQRFDLIACNPPYIRTGELDGLQAEVHREPRPGARWRRGRARVLPPHRRDVSRPSRRRRSAVSGDRLGRGGGCARAVWRRAAAARPERTRPRHRDTGVKEL